MRLQNDRNWEGSHKIIYFSIIYMYISNIFLNKEVNIRHLDFICIYIFFLVNRCAFNQAEDSPLYFYGTVATPCGENVKCGRN